MNLEKIIPWIQIGSSIILIACILLQQKGQGLSAAFGGSGGFYRTKRGFERTLFLGTIVLAAIFILSGIINIYIHR